MKARHPENSSKKSVSQDAQQGEPRLSAKQAIQLEILKIRMSEVTSWVGHIIQVTAVFGALNVGLYKFALDANATPSLRRVLSLVGISASFAGLVCCILMERLRRSNYRDQARLFEALDA
ncbi:MAG TPA: hypothetical protein VFF31_04065, partial [Blastocatellia bacterium]|nr:hypothetical protein [Blastocatellia bacterium]